MSKHPIQTDGLSAEERRALFAQLLREREGRSGSFPLSFPQQRLWFIDRLGSEAAYNVPLALRLTGRLDVAALERSLTEILARHEVLRAAFTHSDGQPRQVIAALAGLDLSVVDLSESPAPDRESQARRLATEETEQTFDLAKGPLIRAKLLRLGAQEHVFLVTMHHIVSDGWSVGVFNRELAGLYQAFSTGQPSPLPLLPIQYVDFARWQRNSLQGDVLDKLVAYWRRQLVDLPVLELPKDRPRPAREDFRGSWESRVFPRELSESLMELSRREGVTLFMTLLAGFQVLLQRYSGQDDVVVGTPIASRTRSEVEGLIGFFVNTLVMRGDGAGNPGFREYLGRVREMALEAYAHQDLPFEKLVEVLDPERDLSRNPLVQVMFAVQNAPIRPLELTGIKIGPLEFPGLGAVPLGVPWRTTRFDLELHLWEQPEGLRAHLVYSTSLFDAATIRRMLLHYERVLEAVVANPEGRISEVALLDEAERRRVLVQWNETATAYPRAASVHELFEAQAARTPEAVAVAYDGKHLSYRELDERSTCLAHHLRGLGVGPEVLVGLYLERSVEMVVGLLGILKAGGAYVPLDPAYPAERLAFMLQDTQAQVVVTRSELSAGLPETAARVVCLDRDWPSIEGHGTGAVASGAGAESLAYVIYTSGSTGTPKGVQVTHRAISRLVRNTDYIDILPTDRLAQASVASFDAATFEIWGALLNGAQVVGVSREVLLSPREFSEFLRTRGITVLFLTTALFNQMAREAPAAFRSLRCVLFGGEAVDSDSVRAVLRDGPPHRLLHVYGPTEVTTFSTWHLVAGLDQAASTVPIGRPIANTTAYVLDEHRQPVPVGVPGELYLGGDGLARGYLERPELTAERFVDHPFSEETGARLYRTGDWVRYLPDGAIEYIGRRDNQVKIRGHRIELGEVEAALGRLAPVQEAVVLVREDTLGDKRLVAYVVRKPEVELSVGELRGRLRESLPEFMVPSAFEALDALPLTPNGKVDRGALPAPAGERQVADAYVAPRGELEARIAGIWRDALRVERVGVHDNFFDLGGHSFLVLKVRDRLSEALGVEVSAVTLFQHSTVASLARHFAGEIEERSLLVEARARARRRANAGMGATPIAVVGMAGRFPGAADIERFWLNLRAGVESIRFFSDEELAAAGVPQGLRKDASYVPARGVLDNAELFDASFFRYTPREADLMDPQQRIFLECAWEALEHAGHDPARYPGLIGVYAGSSRNSYYLQLVSQAALGDAAGSVSAALASDHDFLPTRVSYKLNLHGPSVNIQTACSTSLVAVHEACRALVDHQCDMALAGGVSVLAPRIGGYVYQEQGIASPDGHCRAFDADAAGTVGGEGVGIVVLKRLDDALADGDTVHAVILGTAINNDGSDKVGFTAPSVEWQAGAIALAQATAGVKPESVTYIETHGTGTALGDPIEIAALTRVFGARSPDTPPCALGALKTNIGHLDAAAGVAGLIKAVLVLKHRELPPTLHFKAPNPEIDLKTGRFFVNAELRPWTSAEGVPRRAGVSSFGMGGTNAHAVLEEAPVPEPTSSSRSHQLLLLSARTPEALGEATVNLAEALNRQPDLHLADAAFTLKVGRHDFLHRQMIVCRDAGEAIAGLETQDPRFFFRDSAECTDRRSVVFMFSGQGSQYPNMALGLYEGESVFRSQVDQCCEMLIPHLPCDLRTVIYPGHGESEQAATRLEQTQFAQPALFVIEYALARLLMSWGVQPAAMIGHSIGEYVAASIAGVMSLEDALKLVAHRARLMQGCERGAMLAVPLGEEEIRPLLGESISLAAVNGPGLCVISGSVESVERLESQMRERNLDSQRLRTSHAFHSGMMDPILESFGEHVGRISLNPPQIPYLSNVTGSWARATEVTEARYWVRHVRETVRFGAGVQELLKETGQVLLEVGPGQTLRSLAKHQANEAPERVLLSSMRHRDDLRPDTALLLHALGRLWVAGVHVDWSAFYADERRHRVPLPTYPFERKRFWIEPEHRPVGDRSRQGSRKKPEIAEWFYTPSWKQAAPLALCIPGHAAPRVACWLVFIDKSGLGSRLVKRLEQMDQFVVAVTAGERFARIDARTYAIDPRKADDYDALLEALRSLDRQPQVIVHMWGVESDALQASGPAAFGEVQDRSTYSVLFLAQSLGKQASTDSFQVWVVSSGLHNVTGDEVLHPEKATVLGPCRVIPQEYTNIACKSIDVVVPEPGTAQEQRLIEQLTREKDARPNDVVVAIRGAHRWVQSFEPTRLEDDAEAKPRLREGGVYLITGGLGRVGLALAEYLARTVRAKLVLTGRAGLPPRNHWAQWSAPDASGYLGAFALAEEVGFIAQAEEGIRNTLRIRGIRDYDGLERALDDLCSSHVYDFLKRNAIDVAKGRIYEIADLRHSLRISPRFEKLYRCMIRMLAEDRIVGRKGDAIEFLRDEHEVLRPEVARHAVEDSYPQFKGMLDLLGHCVSHYGQALTDEIDAISVLYPDGSSRLARKSEEDTVEHSQAPVYRTLLKDVVCRFVGRSRERRIRILEVGAGQGLLADLVAPSLRNKNVEYHFTDIGRAFVLNAERRAAAQGLDFMKFGTLDISRDPVVQGYERGSFDVVLGLNVVHATKSIEETVGHLKSLLVPGGMMLLVEAVISERWVDMTTGLAEGWWFFDDDIRRDSPLISLVEWEDVCQRQDFQVSAFPQGEAQRLRADHGLIVAQKKSTVGVRDPSAGVAPGATTADPRTQRAIRKVLQMEKLGAEVLVFDADVSDPQRMQGVVTEVRGRFGGINGVIHAAGRTDQDVFSLIENTSTKDFEAHFQPKVRGLFVLDSVLRDEALDFRILLSSNVSVLGGLRSVAYSAANLFMDAFAQKYNRGSELPWTSTNWDRWGYLEELKEEQGSTSAASIVELAMTLEECVEAFKRILSAGPVPQIVVSTGDLKARGEQWVELGRLRDGGRSGQGEASPLHSRPSLKAPYVAPRNGIEQAFVDIWSQSLGIEQVGIHDNFFELGGDSIISMQIVAKARQAGFRLTTNQFFERQTIAELAGIAGTSEVISIEQDAVTGTAPLTPIQHWFFEQHLPDPDHFNLVIALESRQILDRARLEEAVRHLVAHHDALRLRYRQGEAGWEQVNADLDDTFPFKWTDLSTMSRSEQEAAVTQGAAELDASLSLASGPLVAVAHFDLGSGNSDRLLITVHHLVMDAISCHILLEDLHTAYQQLGRGEAIRLPAKTTAFKQWARQLTEYAQSAALRVEADFWLSPSWSPVSALPVDNPGGVHTAASSRNFVLSLSVDETRALLQGIPKAYGAQISEALLTALAQTLLGWTGARSHVVTVESDGREQIIEGVDLSRTVGWFTTVFPARLDLTGASGPGDALKAIKEQIRRIPNRGIGYGLLRYLGADRQIRERLTALPQPEVSFVYMGQHDQILPHSSPFGLKSIGLSSGAGVGDRRHLLEIGARVIEGRLQMSWAYGEQIHRESTINGLAHDFMDALRALIAHCESRESVDHTPSDFTGRTLSQEDLDKIIARSKPARLSQT